MNGIMDREHTLVIDLSTAQGSVEAIQILEDTVSKLTRMPGEKLNIGLDCGHLLLTQRVLEKMIGLLESHHVHLHTIYARLPQTQQTALGLDLFVKEAPPQANQQTPWQAYFDELKEAKQPQTHPTKPGEQEGAQPQKLNASTPETALPFQAQPTTHPEKGDQAQKSGLDSIKQLAKDFLSRTLREEPSSSKSNKSDHQPTVQPHSHQAMDPFERAMAYQPSSDTAIESNSQNLDKSGTSFDENQDQRPKLNASTGTSLSERAQQHEQSNIEQVQTTSSTLTQPNAERAETTHEALEPMETEELQPLPLPITRFDDQIPTRLVEGPIRSGQAAYSDGHLVIIGDVHGGSELVAKGSIVVWGELRGIAQAGAEGDLTSTIRALAIHAIQLRIGNIFARRPDRVDYHKQPTLQELSNLVMPEVAQVIEGEVKIFKDASGRIL